ncbi:alkaline phosphatase D family protein [Bacillus swezeyi]|uniref:Alkaline phosphatase n=1 Tax=Bacillus swezeyi TaxID=1925020 RepID=A0A1R1QJK1_9BACI|nr:alkaline phosphatase D family protein [Bacillus swezeyi]MEC1262836.1 alkaline phosphatase D family protein [Bacillus swezeyi]MED2928305.1 alkaline phosphatase D family protein [Bacillus swezeyi]MED2944695.1 alkaline phosphatase D family protein [Bacillus swezeyi]MED2966420.1 alkaline phosphatase D family protein [Bacillus swezeyi]MED2975296.1 alkaline phosphatase D family protein [Bacillus swezeyi]
MYDAMSGRRFHPAAQFTSLVSRGLMPEDASLAAEAPRFTDNPFKLGVASGEPHPDGFVLWTRLAPDPLAEDGLGGMPKRHVPVQWEVAEDEHFRKIVKRGTAAALPELAHSVHVEVHGLKPGRYYWYRFKAGREISRTGRTKTAPSPFADLSGMSFALASCQAWYHGYFTAYRHMAEDHPDVVFFLGDYIYEYPINSKNLYRNVKLSSAHNAKTVTLSQYRLRYSLFKTDPDLQSIHALAPWVVTMDDHEVENNYAGAHSQYKTSPDDFLRQRAAAYQAFYENIPIRSASIPNGPDMLMYRRFRYGKLAEFNVLDTRQYRNDYPSNEAERLDPSRSILGSAQERWLFHHLSKSDAIWNMLVQQVVLAQIDRDTGPGVEYSTDQWDGFPACRDRLFSAYKAYGIKNPVVLTGDIHRHAAADLKTDFNDIQSETIGTELITTSISSDADGSETDSLAPIWLGNPHVKLYNAQRGYVRCKMIPKHIQADFQVLPYITRPGAPVSTYASFVIEAGRPGLQRVL